MQGMANVKAAFAIPDEYQPLHLITQGVNELCPAFIWQSRNSAAHQRPPPASG
jgi:hypothetical protein